MRGGYLLFGIGSVLLSHAEAQAGPWGQCGGVGWTGPKTCIAGYSCVYQNDWYYQCHVNPSSVASTTSSSRSSSTTAPSTLITRTSSTTKASSSTTPASTSTVQSACSAEFTPISASAAIKALTPGWNLGNSLDAVPNEDSWNNGLVQETTFDDIKALGFKSVRIPVTWHYHMSSESPSWDIQTAWMDRVEVVVDQALARGFSVILNVHHDSWIWADVTAPGVNLTMIEEKFSRIWFQIGARFKCKPSSLIFEALNEPTGSTKTHGDELNKLNDIFLNAINNAGGHNPKRVVSLGGLGHDIVKTTQWFKRGTSYPNQPWGLQFHYYSPYDFIFGAWGKTIWGSGSDKAALDQDFALFKQTFPDVPTFVGEWDASPANTEAAARWKYFDHIIRTATKYSFSQILWDNGDGHFNRVTHSWKDPAEVQVLMLASKGVSNALADSTTDGSATTQVTNAYLFHRVGDPVTAQSVNYTLNGNRITAIKDKSGTALTSSQYSVSGGTVTFSATYLGTLYSAASAPGIKQTLTVSFNAGASLTLTIVHWSPPTVANNTFKIDPSRDLTFPVSWNGIGPAAVKAVTADGTYLADAWTVGLGPLQQARWTYGNWENKDGTFTIFVSGLNAIKATGKDVILTLEAFPRILGANSVNVTLTQ